jgi:hypothetical protein
MLVVWQEEEPSLHSAHPHTQVLEQRAFISPRLQQALSSGHLGLQMASQGTGRMNKEPAPEWPGHTRPGGLGAVDPPP